MLVISYLAHEVVKVCGTLTFLDVAEGLPVKGHGLKLSLDTGRCDALQRVVPHHGTGH